MPIRPKQQPPYYQSSTLQGKSTILLTNAEIIALADAEIEIAPGAGTNKILVPTYANITWKNWHTDYGNINGTSELYFYVVEITLGTALQSSSQITAIFNPGFATQADFFPKQSIITGQDATAAINQPIKLFFDNKGSGILTGGNIANEIIITTYYTIINL